MLQEEQQEESQQMEMRAACARFMPGGDSKPELIFFKSRFRLFELMRMHDVPMSIHNSQL